MAVIFRTAYEQVGNTLPLWISDTERHIGSWVIPMTWFQSLNPLFIFLLTPLVTRHWVRLAKSGREPSSVRKMSMGALTVALSYLVLAIVAAWSRSHGSVVSWLWVAGFFALMTAGELYILPVGLGLFGRLAPSRYTATGIALWFLAAFGGNLAAGALGMLWSSFSPTGFFCAVAAVATLCAIGLLFFDGAIRRAMQAEG
jgi:POT family proton-dependent oligopeptide transporter